MHIHLVSLFPEIFESFLATSLIQKAQTKGILKFSLHNPREYCQDKHQQIDDQIYGGGEGMLIKAQPIIDCVEAIIQEFKFKKSDFSILFPAPAQEVFNQKIAYGLSKKDHLILICGRYEGIDYRAEQYFQKHYSVQFRKLSLGQFIVL
jgi:tRNA (guanine-1)-methyltransferase